MIATLGIPATAHAADKDTDRWMDTYMEFKLTGGKAGEKVQSLSSGTVKRNFTSWDEYAACYDVAVTLSGGMESGMESCFYWSEHPYQNEKGQTEQTAVLKADESHPWSEESYMMFQVADIACGMKGIEIEMGASADGPRDYKISYSTDQGKTWSVFHSFGSDRGTAPKARHTGDVFKKNISDIQRSYQSCQLMDQSLNTYLNANIYDDIFFKVSVVSDYKADGTAGLYGSTAGEWGIRSVKMLGGIAEAYDPPGTPGYLEAYKTSEKTAALTWMTTSGEGYEIYLKKGNGGYKKIATGISPDCTEYKLRNLSAKAVYKLRMRAYCDRHGEREYGHYSKEATLNMKKQPLPKNLTVKKFLSVKSGKNKRLAVTCTGGTGKSYIKSANKKSSRN